VLVSYCTPEGMAHCQKLEMCLCLDVNKYLLTSFYLVVGNKQMDI